MTPDQLDTTIAELIRALDERKPDCMCQVSPRTAAVALAHFEALKKAEVQVPISSEALNTMRQWFDSLQDTNSAYLNPGDYLLAAMLYERLGMRVPESIASLARE